MDAFTHVRRAMGRNGFDTGTTGFAPIDPARATTESHYDALGIGADASPVSIKAAYRAIAREKHPDKNNGDDSEEFRKATEAYRILSDPESRMQYDVSRGTVQDDEVTDCTTPGAPRGGSVVVRVGLADVYRGCTRTVRFERYDTPTQGRLAVVQVRISSGTPHLARVVVPGEGNARSDGSREDLTVVVKHVIPPGIVVEGRDILCGATLSLGQAVGQQPFIVSRPDGTMLNVAAPRAHTCGPGTWWRLAGHGLPGNDGNAQGDLFIVVSVVFPPVLPTATADYLRTAFADDEGNVPQAMAAVTATPCCCPAPGRTPTGTDERAGCPVQ